MRNPQWHRSIPACAGEPTPCRRRVYKPSVYPRVRGGTEIAHITRSLKGGLSPRARGNRDTLAYSGADERSIPACAGEPWKWAFEPLTVRVYPRVRGGTSQPRIFLYCAGGLSPRARGNLAHRDLDR